MEAPKSEIFSVTTEDSVVTDFRTASLKVLVVRSSDFREKQDFSNDRAACCISSQVHIEK